MDYEIARAARQCASTGREFAEGEEFYSVVESIGGELRRRDLSLAAWDGPPAAALAWWKSRVPKREENKNRPAPSELLLELFHQLGSRPEQAELRYVLTLLMIRRRILRLEDSAHDAHDIETLTVYCPRDEASYQVAVVDVTAEQVEKIQDDLSRLLTPEANQ